MAYKIIFFGASVTEQSITSQTKELVGFVDNTVSDLQNKNIDFEYERMGFGSCHLNDAGFLYVNEVISKKPDLVILDWHSTGITEFNEAKYDFIMKRFAENNIKVLTMIFPLMREGNDVSKKIQQARAYLSDNSYIYNFYPLIGNKIITETVLRDVVHTNAEGGKVYGQLVAEAIEQIISTGKFSNIDVASGDVIYPSADLSYNFNIHNYQVTSDLTVLPETALEISITNAESNTYLQLFAAFLVGPHSSILNIELNDNAKYNVHNWDEYCGYNRTTIKAATPRVQLKAGQNKILIKVQSPWEPPVENKYYDLAKNSAKKAVFKNNIFLESNHKDLNYAIRLINV